MSLKIRLARGGSKKDAHYKVVVIESTKSRDGKAVDIIGHYHPNIHDDKNRFVINAKKVEKWISCGAIPTDVIVRLGLKNGLSSLEKFSVKRIKGVNFGKSRKEIKAQAKA